MAILRIAAAVLALGACYAPELADCAVTCASSDDCGPGQACDADSWCASPTMAGRCERPDGGATNDAAMVGDAFSVVDAAPDAPAHVTLVVQIGGHGRVTIASVGTCADTAPGHQCTFSVTTGIPRVLVAEGTGEDEFDRWTGACAGQGASCALTPVAATTTQAKFKNR